MGKRFDRLIYTSKMGQVELGVLADATAVAVFFNNYLLSVFRIQELWDMLRDNLASTEVSEDNLSGFNRRVHEARAAIAYTNKEGGRYEKDE